MISIMISTNDGTMCISQSSIWVVNGNPAWKASIENMLTKRIARIVRILGAQ